MGSTLEDSRKNRKKVITFLVGRGGYVSSGENDNLIGWLYHQISNESYAHERVGQLKITIEQMAVDGALFIERSSKDRIKSLTLSTETSVDIDDDDWPYFNDPDSMRNLVLHMMDERDRLKRVASKAQARADDVEAAFDQLSAEVADHAELLRLQTRVKELESHICLSQCECADQIRVLEAKMRTLRGEHAREINTIEQGHQQSLKDLAARYKDLDSIADLLRQAAEKRDLPLSDLMDCFKAEGVHVGLIISTPV